VPVGLTLLSRANVHHARRKLIRARLPAPKKNFRVVESDP
jgi:hypothetical protein